MVDDGREMQMTRSHEAADINTAPWRRSDDIQTEAKRSLDTRQVCVHEGYNPTAENYQIRIVVGFKGCKVRSNTFFSK